MIKIRQKYTNIGEAYNFLKVLGYEFKIGDNWYVVTECQCGKIQVNRVNPIVNKTIHSCGICKSLHPPKLTIGAKFRKYLTITDSPCYNYDSHKCVHPS